MDLSIQRERERREREAADATAQYRASMLAETSRHNTAQEEIARMRAEQDTAPTPVNYQFREVGPNRDIMGFDPRNPTNVVPTGMSAPPPSQSLGDPTIREARLQDMEDQRISRASNVVRRLASAGQPYGEAALHPDVKGVISPDEIRGLYESERRNITAANTVQQGRELTNANRAAPDDDAALMAALLGGEQPQQTGMRIPNPVARSGAMAQERKPLQDRVAELKAQGVSKEEAKAILIREGYPVR